MAVFYSFHYQQDYWRVQQVMNMGVVDGQHLNSQAWETVKSRGDKAIKDWIEDEMRYKSAVIVLNGRYTAKRPWVQYEINRAWQIRKPLLAVDINRLLDRNGHNSPQGGDPFACIQDVRRDFIPHLRPIGTSQQVYDQIHNWLAVWADKGYARPRDHNSAR